MAILTHSEACANPEPTPADWREYERWSEMDEAQAEADRDAALSGILDADLAEWVASRSLVGHGYGPDCDEAPISRYDERF